MTKVHIEQIPVEPAELSILDVKQIEDIPSFFAMYPTYYNVRLLFSPLVIQRMLQWLIKQGYIVLDGTLTLKIRTQKGALCVSSKKEENAEKNGPSG